MYINSSLAKYGFVRGIDSITQRGIFVECNKQHNKDSFDLKSLGAKVQMNTLPSDIG